MLKGNEVRNSKNNWFEYFFVVPATKMCYSNLTKQSRFPINKQAILTAAKYYRSIYHPAICFINHTLLETIQ